MTANPKIPSDVTIQRFRVNHRDQTIERLPDSAPAIDDETVETNSDGFPLSYGIPKEILGMDKRKAAAMVRGGLMPED